MMFHASLVQLGKFWQQATAAMGASLVVRFWETLVVGHAAAMAGEMAGGDLSPCGLFSD